MVLPAPEPLHPRSLPPQERHTLTAAWRASTLACKDAVCRSRTWVQHGYGKSSAPSSENLPPSSQSHFYSSSHGARHGPQQQHFKQGFSALAAELLLTGRGCPSPAPNSDSSPH